MNFLVDAQLPRIIATRLIEQGHDAKHTLDLPDGNRTTDATICAVAEKENRVVMTKDADFVNSFLLLRKPPQLLLISTGNITNANLEAIFVPQIAAISVAFSTASFIELTRTAIIVHM